MAKKNVLWFSRHTMTAEQLDALEAKLGPITINQIDRTINAAKELSSEIAEADIVAIVAPIQLQQQFLQLAGEGKPVIQAISDREIIKSEDGTESKTVFKFREWQRIRKIIVETEHFA